MYANGFDELGLLQKKLDLEIELQDLQQKKEKIQGILKWENEKKVAFKNTAEYKSQGVMSDMTLINDQLKTTFQSGYVSSMFPQDSANTIFQQEIENLDPKEMGVLII